MEGLTIFSYHYLPLNHHITLRYAIAQSRLPYTRANILLLQGRAEFIEKYEGIAGQLSSEGYRVVTLDFRGQGLSSRQVENRQKGYVDSFDRYVDDLDKFYDHVFQADGLKVFLLAHSMGGHVGLRFMHRRPSAIERAVLVSPLIDIPLIKGIKGPMDYVAKRACLAGRGGAYVPFGRDYFSKKPQFKFNFLSHDPDKFQAFHDKIKLNNDLAIGDVTWAWLNAAMESIKILQQAEYAGAITVPIMLMGAQNDRIVSFRAQEAFSQWLPCCRFVSFPGAWHEIMFEAKEIRDRFWSLFFEFIDPGSL